MELYQQKSYKTVIRSRIKELQESKRGYNLKKLAHRVRIQYTFLSKILNDDCSHVSEERLFQICKALEFSPSETEFVLTLRAYQATNEEEWPEWKEELFRRLEMQRKSQRLNADLQEYQGNAVSGEMRFLFDPLAEIVYVSLFLEPYRKNTRLICSQLGISPGHLKEILRTLSDAGFVELAEDGLSLKKILKNKVHFGRDHPLMRLHQSILKTNLHSQLMRTPEQNKHSVLVTFTTDENGFEAIKERFQAFLKEVETLAEKHKDAGVYQLNFDLLRWI